MLTDHPEKARGETYLSLSDEALVGQCHVDRYRASGPGGQKVNKTSSAIRLRHGPTGLVVTAQDDRSQRVNKVRAIRRLREAITLHVRAEIDPDTYEPSKLPSGCITGEGQIRVSSRNERYHPAVSELLDILSACGTRTSDAAKRIGISTAHLVQFLRKDPKLWDRVNQMRAAAGLKPLR